MNAAGLMSYQAVDIPHPVDETRFGYGVTAGDLTGDGVDEIVIADGYACCSSGKQAGRPSLYIFSVVAGTPTLLQRLVPTNGTTTALATYGRHLAIADVNGDGTNDIVVATETWGDGKLPNAGAVLLHHGSGAGPTWISPTAVLLVDAAPARERRFGAAVVAGDVVHNGDAAHDVVAIVKSEATGEVFSGPLLVTGQTSVPAWRLPAINGWIRGWWTRPPASGDLNGDGLTDLVFGAPHAPDDTTCDTIGAAQIFLAEGTTTSGLTGWRPFLLTPPDLIQGGFGWAVALAPNGRLLLVTERGRQVSGASGTGVIYVYRFVP